MPAVADQTRLGAAVLRILESSVPDAQLSIETSPTMERLLALQKRQHPFVGLLEAAGQRDWNDESLIKAASRWNDLRTFKQLIDQFRLSSIDVYAKRVLLARGPIGTRV